LSQNGYGPELPNLLCGWAFSETSYRFPPCRELFNIILGCGLSLGGYKKQDLGGTPQESVFAQHFYKETTEETISNLFMIWFMISLKPFPEKYLSQTGCRTFH